jgi:hypothetical protein
VFRFLAIIGACLVFARRFAGTGQRVRAIYSAGTGIFFLVSFLRTALGSGLVALTPALWVAITLAGCGSQPWRRI